MASDALGDKRHKIAVRNDQWRSQKVRDHRDDPPFEAELGQVFVRPEETEKWAKVIKFAGIKLE